MFSSRVLNYYSSGYFNAVFCYCHPNWKGPARINRYTHISLVTFSVPMRFIGVVLLFLVPLFYYAQYEQPDVI